MSLSLAISSLLACAVNLAILFRFHEETRKLRRELRGLRGVVRLLLPEGVYLEGNDGFEPQRPSSPWRSFLNVWPTLSEKRDGRPS
jgi:hypothetical protein